MQNGFRLSLVVTTAVLSVFASGARASAGRTSAVSTVADGMPGLPRLDLTGFLPAVQQQVQQAYDLALAHPDDASANGALGMALDAYEQYDAAAICYERAHQLDAHAFRWLYLLGWVQAAQGRHEDAAQTFDQALRLNSDDLGAKLHRAESLLAIGRLDEAAFLYESVLRVQSAEADAHYGLGRVAAARGDWHAAMTAYQKACELFPSYGAARYALATAFRRLGREDDAQHQLRLYEQDQTGAPPLDDPLRRDVTMLNLGSVAHIRRGADLERAGRIAEAIDEQLAALRVDPQAVQAHINLVALYGRLGRYDEATAQYELARALDPSQADLHYNQGILLLRQQRSVEAAGAFREALRLNPHYPEAHNRLGAIYEDGGDLSQALEQFTAALSDRPADRAAHFHVGRILANEQRYDEAIAHLTQTLAPEDASTPRYLYALGATYARAARTADALKYLREAREQAASRNQTALVTAIDRDLRTLERAGSASPQ